MSAQKCQSDTILIQKKGSQQTTFESIEKDGIRDFSKNHYPSQTEAAYFQCLRCNPMQLSFVSGRSVRWNKSVQPTAHTYNYRCLLSKRIDQRQQVSNDFLLWKSFDIISSKTANTLLSIPLQRSEKPSHGMHQLPADQLQKQHDQLPMKNRNPFVLNFVPVQRTPSCKTSQQPAVPSMPLTFIRRPHNLFREAMRIARLNSTTMEPMFLPELRKRGLSMVNTLRPQRRDLDKATTTSYNSLVKQQ